MESIEDAFSALIRARLEERGENAFAFEQKMGLPADAVRNVIRDGVKRARPNLARVKELCDALNLELYFGPRRDTGPVEQIILDGTDYAHIPVHQASLSAGPGADNAGSNITDHLAFRRDWLKRIGVSANKACLARVTGHSMEPTLWSGDMVLIDQTKTDPVIRKRSETDLRRPPIYAFVQSGEARVKRIERPSADAMILISDNPEVAPELRSGTQAEQMQLTIIGRVVWSGHTLGG